MQSEIKRPKAKRKLKDVDFSSSGSHIALVSQDQGNGANGHHYAVTMKATDFSDEILEKMQQVKVTLDLPDFLTRFFGIYGEDAQVLARMMGYVEVEDPEEDEMEMAQDYQEWIKERMQAFEIVKSANETEDIYSFLADLSAEDYLALLQDQELLEKALDKVQEVKDAEKLAAERQKKKVKLKPASTERSAEDPYQMTSKSTEEVQKAAKGDMVSWGSSGGTASGKIKKIVSSGTVKVPGTDVELTATEEEPVALITLYRDGKPTDQVVGHKVSTLRKSKESSEVTEEVTEVDTSTNASVEKKVEASASVVKSDTKETPMTTTDVSIVEKVVDVELVEKAQFDSVQKSLSDALVELQKARDLIAQFETDKKNAIMKSRKEKVEAAVKDSAKAEILFKAVSLLESDEDFEQVVKTLGELTSAVEKSSLFVEQGASTEDTPAAKESAVAKMLKARVAK